MAKGESKGSKGKGQAKGSKGNSKGGTKGDSKGKGKGQGKSKGNHSQSLQQPSEKQRLQTRAIQFIMTKPEGVCGGFLSQMLNDHEEAALQKLFGAPDGKLQKGWLQNLMRGAMGVMCERNSCGRDHMFFMAPGAMPPYPFFFPGMMSTGHPGMMPTGAPPMASAAPAASQRMTSATPAGSMTPEDFLGKWVDSLGNNIVVHQDAHEKKTALSAVLSKPPRRDIVLGMNPSPVSHPTVKGLMTWRCGNSILQVPTSTSEQLCWASNDGRLSVWVRSNKEDKPDGEAKTDEKKEDGEKSEEKKDEEKDEGKAEKK